MAVELGNFIGPVTAAVNELICLVVSDVVEEPIDRMKRIIGILNLRLGYTITARNVASAPFLVNRVSVKKRVMTRVGRPFGDSFKADRKRSFTSKNGGVTKTNVHMLLVEVPDTPQK